MINTNPLDTKIRKITRDERQSWQFYESQGAPLCETEGEPNLPQICCQNLLQRPGLLIVTRKNLPNLI